jgi:tyrosinase
MSHLLLHRKSVHVLEDPQHAEELNRLRIAFHKTMYVDKTTKRKDDRGYAAIAGFHGVPWWYCFHHQTTALTPISGPFFLPWHRAYLLHLEIILRQNSQDPTVTIPYWDWSSQKSRTEGIPNAYKEENMPNGDPNPLKTFHIELPNANPPIDRDTQRYPDDPSLLPTDERVQNIINNDNDFDDFLLDLQEIHDSVHGWFDNGDEKNPSFGDMSSVSVASYDPIFYAHHCMVDRIWYLWQLKHGLTTGFEKLLDYPLAPFHLTVKNVIDVRDRGYDYAGDIQEVAVSVGMGG